MEMLQNRGPRGDTARKNAPFFCAINNSNIEMKQVTTKTLAASSTHSNPRRYLNEVTKSCNLYDEGSTARPNRRSAASVFDGCADGQRTNARRKHHQPN